MATTSGESNVGSVDRRPTEPGAPILADPGAWAVTTFHLQAAGAAGRTYRRMIRVTRLRERTN
jgi:hypothetical protein